MLDETEGPGRHWLEKTRPRCPQAEGINTALKVSEGWWPKRRGRRVCSQCFRGWSWGRGRGGEKPISMQVYNKGSRQSEHQSSAIKEFSILCMGRCKPMGSLNSLLHMHLSYLGPILFPCSPSFLHSPSSSTNCGGQQHLLDLFWEPSFTFGG